jgi:hypothetical protein
VYAKTDLKRQWHCRGEKMRDNGKRRYVMGDKGKKDKKKRQNQKTAKQQKKAKRKLAKQRKRTP